MGYCGICVSEKAQEIAEQLLRDRGWISEDVYDLEVQRAVALGVEKELERLLGPGQMGT